MYKCEVFKMVELDNYENGCMMVGGSDFGLVETLTAKTISELVSKLKSSYDLKHSETFENRIETQRTENADGDLASARELESWKHGIIDLYLANYSFYFSEVTETEIFPSVMIGFFKGESVS